MKNNFCIKLFCLIMIASFLTFYANAYEFKKDLKLGDLNSDVLELQKILNSDDSTAIAISGLGSKGNETNYFGNLTKQAIIRFQEKYSNDILVPNGLSKGTGFVGLSTRKKIGSISATNIPGSSDLKNSHPVSSKDKSSIVSGVVSPEFLFGKLAFKDVIIKNISAFEVKVGDKINIIAGGVLNENNLHIGDAYSKEISSNSNSIEMTVPNIPNGIYQVWIENKNGSSKTKSPQYIKISNQSKSSPVISRSYPQDASVDSIITLEGSGFDQQNNTIYSTLGILNGVPSKDGKILFSIKDFPEIKKNLYKDFQGGGVVTYSVKSSNGYSNNFGIFKLSSHIAKKNNFFKSILSFIGNQIDSVYGTKQALAFVSRMHDGGTIGGVDTECTCSGSELVKYSSYVDDQDYKYIYSYLTTETYSNYDQTTQDQYFLATLIPYGECMVYEGEDCNSEGSPDGTLTGIGSS